MSLISFVKQKEIKELRSICNCNNIENLQEFLQQLENKRAKTQNRLPSTVEVWNLDNNTHWDDEFISEENKINIYYRNNRSVPEIYASLIHESNHANQFHISNRDINNLSKFDKTITLFYKTGFCYNTIDDTNEISPQYLYNFNEMDSKVEETRSFLSYIQTDINNIETYRTIIENFLNELAIYNKQDLKDYEKWFVKHYNTYHNQPENDIFGIMDSVLNLEEKYNINILQMFNKEFKQINRDKLKQLINLRDELKEIAQILNKGSVDRETLLEKYKNKYIKTENVKDDDLEL